MVDKHFRFGNIQIPTFCKNNILVQFLNKHACYYKFWTILNQNLIWYYFFNLLQEKNEHWKRPIVNEWKTLIFLQCHSCNLKCVKKKSSPNFLKILTFRKINQSILEDFLVISHSIVWCLKSIYRKIPYHHPN